MGTGLRPASVERVAAFLTAAGAEARLEELAADCSSAQAAADAIGCALGQIVKSLVLVCDELPVLALVSGEHRADTAGIACAVGRAEARIATAEEVIAITGFEPGTVAPFPPARAERVLLDRHLLAHRLVWAGAGSSRHLVALAPAELVRLARAEVRAVARKSA
jgi:prolyl-tRNA editing enzyme YbaK/EbsC (Cys-tRNA(Pro) deacylase)